MSDEIKNDKCGFENGEIKFCDKLKHFTESVPIPGKEFPDYPYMLSKDDALGYMLYAGTKKVKSKHSLGWFYDSMFYRINYCPFCGSAIPITELNIDMCATEPYRKSKNKIK